MFVKEPAFGHHAAREPVGLHQRRGNPQFGPVRNIHTPFTLYLTGAEALAEPVGVGLEAGGAVIRCVLDNVRGQEGRLHGRADAFAALGVGQAGGIADQQDAVVDQGPLGMVVEEVGVALELPGQVLGDPLLGLHPGDEVVEVMLEVVRVLAAQADVEKVVLAEDPGVAHQVPAEPEFRGVLAHPAPFGLLRGHLELHFLGGHRGLMAPWAFADGCRHRAEVATGPDDQWRLVFAVEAPFAVVGAFQGLELDPFGTLAAAALEQVVVELAAADAIADRRAAMIVFHRLLAHHTDPEAMDRLHDVLTSVVRGVDIQNPQYGGRHPAGAGLVPGKGLLVDDQGPVTTLGQRPRHGGTGRAAADDQGIVALYHQ